MSDRVDELKGSLKEGAGKVTGNERLEAEGRGEKEIAKGEREVKGAANQVKGKVEQGIGELTGDDQKRAEGAATEVKGDAQRAG